LKQVDGPTREANPGKIGQHLPHLQSCTAIDLCITPDEPYDINLDKKILYKPKGCSIPGIMASNPLRSSALFPSESQKDGERILSGLHLYSPCALRRKYIVRGFCNRMSLINTVQSRPLTKPHFSSRLAAKRYQRAALRRACFRALRKAAWASRSADGGSSALIGP
jgi:hypothetical protein